jgi:hypothetical protein
MNSQQYYTGKADLSNLRAEEEVSPPLGQIQVTTLVHPEGIY